LRAKAESRTTILFAQFISSCPSEHWNQELLCFKTWST